MSIKNTWKFLLETEANFVCIFSINKIYLRHSMQEKACDMVLNVFHVYVFVFLHSLKHLVPI